MFTKYFTCNTKQKADRDASQDNNKREVREELGEKLGQTSQAREVKNFKKLSQRSQKRARTREELEDSKVEVK